MVIDRETPSDVGSFSDGPGLEVQSAWKRQGQTPAQSGSEKKKKKKKKTESLVSGSDQQSLCSPLRTDLQCHPNKESRTGRASREDREYSWTSNEKGNTGRRSPLLSTVCHLSSQPRLISD